MVELALAHDSLGFDARLYATAARTLLQGGNPWAASLQGVVFAAPPPTLVPFLPFAYLPDPVTVGFWSLATIAAEAWAVRRLRLPWWWLLFTPFVDAAWVGNPDGLVVALLLTGSRVGSVLAAALKIYAVVPLLGERRWGYLALVGAALLLSAPFLPWTLYFTELPSISRSLASQVADGGLSAWGNPFMLSLSLLALVSLGPRRAGWLAVPVLWPYTQLHYSALAFPALNPFLGSVFNAPIPGAAACGVIAYAVYDRVVPGGRDSAKGEGSPHRTARGVVQQSLAESRCDID